jgi:NAD(P)H-quinone oxidoreductase subunit 6
METSKLLVNGVFYAVAAATVAGALAVAFSKNIVRSAFALLAVLFGAAAMYALMKADFVFAIQILVYVGGILVLIIFAIMLTQRIVDVNLSNPSVPTAWGAAAVLSVLLILLIAIFAYQADLPKAAAPGALPSEAMTAKVGESLMREYLYPFEIVSVLLLACLIGAAYLARKEVRS